MHLDLAPTSIRFSHDVLLFTDLHFVAILTRVLIFAKIDAASAKDSSQCLRDPVLVATRDSR